MRLSLALGDYYIVRPLISGEVPVDGADLTVLTAMPSGERHRRFLRGEFDIAELSLSSYFVARDQGLPLSAIPVFPLRRFRHGYVFINTTKGIRRPQDLEGRRVGVSSFQETGPLWMRGILETEYGVTVSSIQWLGENPANVPSSISSAIRLSPMPSGKSGAQMLMDGGIDAYLGSNRFSEDTMRNPRIGRLFPDARTEEILFFKRTGLFPIMHLVAMRAELISKYSWLARSLFRAFNSAKEMSFRQISYNDSAPLAWFQAAAESERELLGTDPWSYGLNPTNQLNLMTLQRFAFDQGLISTTPPIEDLFAAISA